MTWFNNNLFVILLSGGGVSSCVVRGLVSNSVHGSSWAVSICFLCLCWYYYKARNDSAISYHSDNVYYLGLLFTLVALVYSLVTLFMFDSEQINADEWTKELIGSFGIALISTIFGILFRVLLLQHEDAENAEKQLQRRRRWLYTPGKEDRLELSGPRESLADSSFKLRSELTQTIADVSVFRNTVIQSTNETTQESQKARAEINRQMKEAAEEQARMFSTLSASMVDDLGKAATTLQNVVNNLQITARQAEAFSSKSDSLTTGVEQVVVLLEKAMPKIEQATAVLPDTAITFSDSLSQATKIMPQYTQQLEQLVTALQAVTEHWQSINPITQDLQNIVNDLQTTARNTKTLAAGFDPLQGSLQQTLTVLDATVNGIKQAAVTLPDTTRTFADSLNKATETMPQYTQQFDHLVVVLRKEAEQWQLMSQEVRVSLTQAIEDLTRVVRDS